ncbi:amidoligase family protein [Alkalimonas collagenimarina]|uniref:Amidoligase family protein n=1 Tax=Alkalimonas collagenimarina TaxID=400390 RepID=A0ABT9GUS3_9GAMM|nr:amidoligase family protein [Alkalimonas collagenimarina]MDP4534802.1 amidoligase family protein [Alkalimonas collagenimarina]
MTAEIPLQRQPWPQNHENKPRRTGIEIELSGMQLATLANSVAELLQLKAKSGGRYDYILQGDDAGEWVVELDFHLLKEMGKKPRKQDSFSDSAEQLLASVAGQLVPLELVSPPLPFERLADIERIIDLLHHHHAKGSSVEFKNAFGLQLNPEIPSAEPELLLRFLQAFTCLHDWLLQQEQVDVTRKLTSYINPYSKEYVKQLLTDDYQPNLSQLIDDYLTHNPTRNRALDCLPLFMHLDEERVKAVVQDELVKARPTFHYRLPSCEIHQAGWGLHRAWNGWIQVEKLAADEVRLAACCQAYLQHLNKPLHNLFTSWPDIVEQQWLDL